MKEIIDIIITVTGMIAFIGIMGAPFISFTLLGMAALDDFIENEGKPIWFTRKETYFYGFFLVCTIIWVVLLIIRCVIW